MVYISERTGKSRVIISDPSIVVADIIMALYEVKIDLGHFPIYVELKNCKYQNLFSLVQTHGGIAFFRRLMGYEDNYRSSLMSYIIKRGMKTEAIVLSILKDYCKQKKIPEPIINYTFTSGKYIEFVCDTGKKIGIDVTNTRNIGTIRTKWLKRDYHLNLDKLYIVVFSDNISEQDYGNLNKDSPYNVYIMSIEDFCVLIGHELDNSEQNKISKYSSCVFNTKKLKNEMEKLIDIIKIHGNNNKISHSALLRYGHYKGTELKVFLKQAILEKKIYEFSEKDIPRIRWYSICG